MSIAEIIVQIGRVRGLRDELTMLSSDPKLTSGESIIVLAARDYLAEYADELESKIEKKVKE